MKHFYQSVTGYFRPEQRLLYANQVKQSKDGYHFVEIGAWRGRSSSYMAVEIINSGKNIKFDVVDHWLGSSEHQMNPSVKRGTLYDEFINNTKPVNHIINPLRMTSVEASKLYDDNSLDFVFIDASHEYEFVKEDIKHWFPKVREGGIIAGDDMEWHVADSIKRAVTEMIPKHIQDRNMWIYRK